MKFGDHLRQHSVPAWAYYNVDYDAVKRLIKECTSSGKGKAIDIPGQGDNAVANAEKRLYNALVSEHERVELFVKSKSNEIQGRLGNLERSFKRLKCRNDSLVADNPRPYLIQRYVKLEHEAFITGEQIRSLSRFIAAQKTAFRKLLKKYKKWSGSPVLEDRFRAEVLNRPSSFTNTSLAETFDRWTDLLQAARAARQPSQSLNSSPDIRPESHVLRARAPSRKLQESSAVIAQQLSQAVGSLNDVAFDTAFSEVPMGESGTRAVYWVHSEQLIELQVLLLQHLRLYITKPTLETPSLLSQSPVVTRRSSLSVKQDGTAERESDSGVIYLDDPESYGQRQSRATVSDSESLSSSSPLRAAVAARWASSTEDAAVSIRLQKRAGKKGTAMLRQKHLGALLNADRDFKPWKPSGQATPGLDPSEFAAQSTLSADEAREILEQRRELQLLVALLSKRTRFVGLFNSASVGQWATLDSQISYTKVDKDDLTGKDWISKLNRKAQDFPFAILRVRQEGKFAKDLIEVLDQSHLTERVRGFSLISHAIWSCWKPRGMTAPFWLPALEKDIRKVPENVVLGRRRSSQITSAEHGQNSSASSNSEFDRSGSSTAVAADSSATSVPNTPMLERDFGSGLHSIPEQKPKKVTLDEVSFDKTSRRKRREETRYWNEYDNPDSENDANAYYIYIDPNQEDKWPGQDMFQIFARKLRSIFSKGGHVDEVNDEERAFIRPLTEVEDEDEGASSPTDSEPDSPAKISSSIFAVKQKRASKHGGYGTMSSRMGNARLTDLLLPPAATDVSPSKSSRLLISTLSLVAASVLSVLIFTLAATGRKKQKGEVDAGILLGVIASLFFAMVGLVSVLSSRENIGLANWVVIGAVFCTICLADGVLVGYVLV